MYLFMDFETYSPVNLINCGVAKYARHPDADAICGVFDLVREDKLESCKLSFNRHGFVGSLEEWGDSFTGSRDGMNEVKHILGIFFEHSKILIAHNMEFDIEIYDQIMVKKYGFPPIPTHIKPECTRKRQAFYNQHNALSLKKAGAYYNLPQQKSDRGSFLIEELSIPKKGVRKYDDVLEAEMLEYCKQDVETLKSLFFAQQDFAKLFRIQNNDYKIRALDMEINRTGFPVNFELAEKLLVVSDEEKAQAQLDFCKKFDSFDVPSLTQVAEMKCFIKNNFGYELDSVGDDFSDAPDAVKEILSFRSRATKTSYAKAKHIIDKSFEGRLYNSLNYAMAHTGRWTGKDFQPQNLPKESSEDKATSFLRNIISTGKNSTLIRLDYSAIEHRALFYMAMKFIEEFSAECEAVAIHFESFSTGEDLYLPFAADIYNVPLSSLNKESPERAAGKEGHLGLGYRMGGRVFYERSQLNGVNLTLEECHKIVKLYRKKYSTIQMLWEYFEDQFIAVVEANEDCVADLFWGMQIKYFSKLPFNENTNCLALFLPNKRPIFYYDLKLVEDSYNNKSLWIGSQGKKPHTHGGIIVENVIQAVCRDLLAEHMLELSKKLNCAKIVLHVHDEVVVESLDSKLDENIGLIERICKSTPDFFPDFPIFSEMKTSKFYKK